jgi:hypothetical protein
MKRIILAVALALSGMTFITSPVFSETREDPNQVDVSQWQKQEVRVCYENGVKELHQAFTYDSGLLFRRIYQFSLAENVVYEMHIVTFDKNGGVFGFKAIYVKSENTWIRYSPDEEKKIVNAWVALQKKFFPDKVAIIRCEK